MSPLATEPGRLSDVARRLVLPSGLTATEWPSIKRRTDQMGIRYDPWQADLVRGAFGKRKNGKYAASVGGVVWSLPRQVGKTFTVGSMLFAYAIEHPGSLILWTSHHKQTTKETMLTMQAMAQKPRIAPYVDQVLTGSGTEAVLFANGSRILFGARDAGFGLGFAAVDVIVFDEAQRLTDQTRMDMVPATNRAGNPAGALLFYIGTPLRPTDKGDGFASLREGALAGDDDVFYVELSADPDADPDDREQWAKANPSYPHHTPVESMLRMRKHLGSDEAWMREALGIWDTLRAAGVIPADAWASAVHPTSAPVDRLALGVEVAPDLTWASVALAGERADGSWHVALEANQDTHGAGVDWLIPYVAALVEANGIRTVMVDAAGPVKSLLQQKAPRLPFFFKGTRVRVAAIRSADLGAACSNLLSGVVTGEVHHIDQRPLNTAALAAGKRALADSGLWVWSRRAATSDITPIQAATLALHGAQTTRSTRTASSGSGRRVVTG